MERLKILFILITFILIGCLENDKQSIVNQPKVNKDKKIEAINNKIPSRKADGKKAEEKVFIDIQPFEGIQEDMVSYLYYELGKIIPNLILHKPIPLPQSAFYPPRSRYRADTLISIMGSQAKEGHVTIGITNKDISTDNGDIVDWGVMGLGYQPGNACVVSTFRLKNNRKEQLFKVAIHELGHTQGLDHCPVKTCLMRDAEGKNNTDSETGFCDNCKAYLIEKSWKL